MRASYRRAVEWIALNDNSGNGDNQKEIESYVTTLLVADLFDKQESVVAKNIVAVRNKHNILVGETDTEN